MKTLLLGSFACYFATTTFFYAITSSPHRNVTQSQRTLACHTSPFSICHLHHFNPPPPLPFPPHSLPSALIPRYSFQQPFNFHTIIFSAFLSNPPSLSLSLYLSLSQPLYPHSWAFPVYLPPSAPQHASILHITNMLTTIHHIINIHRIISYHTFVLRLP